MIKDQETKLGIAGLFTSLSKKRRRQVAGLLVLMLVGAFVEVLTISSIVPVIAVLADLQSAEDRFNAATALEAFEPLFGDDLILTAVLLFVLLALLSAAVRIFISRIVFWVSAKVASDLAIAIFKSTLSRSYEWHISRNSAETIAGVTKVNNVIASILNPLLSAIVALTVSVFILSFLVFLEPKVMVAACLIFCFAYVSVGVLVKRKLDENSNTISAMTTASTQLVQESSHSVRNVILDRLQGLVSSKFERVSGLLYEALGKNSFIAAFPRYFIESVIIICSMIAVYHFSTSEGGLLAALPVLGAFALGAQRLLPQLQQVYIAWSSISGNYELLNDVLSLASDQDNEYATGEDESVATESQFEELRFDNVFFKYPGSDRFVLENVSLSISAGEKIGIVGVTGSGKSTLLDLILGLIDPNVGSVQINKVDMSLFGKPNWFNLLSHVPQHVFLRDTSIMENISFGSDCQAALQENVRVSARIAQIEADVMAMPHGFETLCGEAGDSLSGGQRQRVGIARAIFKGSPVLILDEATSALDEVTEEAVMASIVEHYESQTVILISHKSSTLRFCDRIFEVSNKSVTEIELGDSEGF